MKKRDLDDLSNVSMMDLFLADAESQTGILNSGLLELERDPSPSRLEALMRAAHSLKGAARIVHQDATVRVAHAMEDCFVAAQRGKMRLQQAEIDLLLQGVDLLQQLARRSSQENSAADDNTDKRIQSFLEELGKMVPPEAQTVLAEPLAVRSPETIAAQPDKPESQVGRTKDVTDRTLRLTAENLNRLLGLAGESLVESRWLHPFLNSMLRLKRLQADMTQSLHGLRDLLHSNSVSERVDDQMTSVLEKALECRDFLSERLGDLEMHDRRSANLSHRLYLEVLQCRMRPFGDGVRRFPRMVRDLSRSLGKKIRLEVVGEHTQVDRDILEKLETPLTHLLRNAVDHGCETPDERRIAGKQEECTIRLEARHSAGMLTITVTDDGRGVHPDQLRQTVTQRKLMNAGAVDKMSEAELLEFLLLPGFTMKETVTELSGRGVGLDVVQTMAKSVRGNVRIATSPGRGMRFQLHLPLTLSVLRTLLVEVDDEPYAIPLSNINKTLKLPREKIETLDGRHHFELNGQQIGLVTAHEVLECGQRDEDGDDLPIIVMGDRTARYGVVVDRFLGERELVVQSLDQRLGKVADISAGSLMEDGSPVLIVDVDDMLCSIEKLVSSGRLNRLRQQSEEPAEKPGKRVLVIDDSLTVREMQRKLLMGAGYAADLAVDGMDGWNAVRAGKYDLVITDVDMPRMDGIELTALIKHDVRLAAVPVIIVSYKDREEDRMRGLEAGADYYLTKGSFHDETLLQAVADLIGEADE